MSGVHEAAHPSLHGPGIREFARQLCQIGKTCLPRGQISEGPMKVRRDMQACIFRYVFSTSYKYNLIREVS